MRILIGAVAVMLLAGCSTSPVPSSQASQASAQQLLKFQSKPAGSFGTVQVIRDSGHTGSLCSMAVFIDGEKVALLDPGQKAAFFVPPGPLTLGAAYSGSGMCGMGAERIERDAVAAQNSVKKYRVFTGGDGQIDILPTTL